MRQAMREDGVVQLSWSQAEEFLAEVEKRRGHRETVGVYRRNLRHFFRIGEFINGALGISHIIVDNLSIVG